MSGVKKKIWDYLIVNKTKENAHFIEFSFGDWLCVIPE